MIIRNWIITDEFYQEDIYNIFTFLADEYIRIFGKQFVFSEQCKIYNDPYSKCPMLIINSNPISIRLSQESPSCWSQMIFQLSHEMCHYVIRQHKIKKNFTLSWFEEIVCEAMSLYSLEYAYKNWDSCRFSLNNPYYQESIKKYLITELDKEKSNTFSNIQTLYELLKYEKNKIAENDRSSQRAERNKLYFALSKEPTSISDLCNYQEYINKDNLTIDFNKWYSDSSNELIKLFSDIQPI